MTSTGIAIVSVIIVVLVLIIAACITYISRSREREIPMWAIWTILAAAILLPAMIGLLYNLVEREKKERYFLKT